MTQTNREYTSQTFGGKTKRLSFTLIGILIVAGGTTPSFSSGNGSNVKEVIEGVWDAGGHRRPTTWLGQGNHRTPSEWLEQGNHRGPVEFIMGVPSKNSRNAKK